MIDIDNNNFFETFFFPGGECGIEWKSLNLIRKPVTLLSRINNGNDLLRLLTVTNALKNEGFELSLFLPYVPGARQDRINHTGEPLSIKVYTDIINAQNYLSVTILDPHSDVAPALINNCIVKPIWPIIREIVRTKSDEYTEIIGYDTILIPDAGATKKIFSYYFPNLEFNKRLTFIQCLKKRDTATGKLSGFRIVDEIPHGSRCLIVDDICDGGGTFIGLKNKLQVPLKKIGLFVTHGIFSRGVQDLIKSKDNPIGFDEIFTTNSIRDNQPKEVKINKIY